MISTAPTITEGTSRSNPTSTSDKSDTVVSPEHIKQSEVEWDRSKQETIDQIEAELDLLQAAVEAERKKNPENKKLEADLKQIQDLKRDMSKRTHNDKYDLATQIPTLLSQQNNTGYENIQRLKNLANDIDADDPRAVEGFKQEVAKYLATLEATSPKASKNSTDKVIASIEEEGNKTTEADKKGLVKLGFWEKIVLNFQLFFSPKNPKWLFEKLMKKKQFNGDARKVLEYMQENFKNLIDSKKQEFKVLQEQFEPLPRSQPEQTQEQKDGEQEEEQKTPTLQEIGASSAKEEEHPLKQETQERPTSLEDYTEPKKTENQVQVLSKEILARLEENEQSKSSARDRIRYATTLIADAMITRNIPLSKTEVDRIFDSVIDSGNILEDENTRRSPMLEYARGSLHYLIKKREEEAKTVRRWYKEGEKYAVEKIRDNASISKNELINKYITRKFVEEIIADQMEWRDLRNENPFDRRGRQGSVYAEDGTRRLLLDAVQRGAIKMEYFEERTGKRYPILKVVDYKDEKGNMISSKVLMSLINGEGHQDVESGTNSPVGLYVKLPNSPSIICLDAATIESEGKRNGLQDYEIEDAFEHEATHAANQGERLIREFILTSYLKDKTLRIDNPDPDKDPQWMKSIFNTEEVREIIKNAYGIEDEAFIRKKTKELILDFIQEKDIGSAELLSIFGQDKTANTIRQYYSDIKNELLGTKLEELSSQAKDMTEPLKLSDLRIDRQKGKDMSDEDKAVLIMMRLFNGLIEQEIDTKDINLQSKLKSDRKILARYLSTYFYNNKPSTKDINALLENVRNNKDHVLHRIIFGHFNEADIQKYIDDQVGDEEIGAKRSEVGKYRATHYISELRHTAAHHQLGFYYGKHGAKDRMAGTSGGHLGAKLDIFSPTAWLHTKDRGPGAILMSSQALAKKNLMDGFGIGLNRFLLDNSDGLEAISFLTGIPVHRLPFLQNLPSWLERHTGGKIKLDRNAWAPKGTYLASPDMYVTYSQKVMYTRLLKEHVVTQESLIKLLPEIGGYDYGAQGNPEEKIQSYTTRDDQYRLNQSLARFIREELIPRGKYRDAKRNELGQIETERDKKGGLILKGVEDRERKDLEEIATRLETDQIRFNGKLTDVVERGGYVVTKEFADSNNALSSRQIADKITSLSADERKKYIVQQGGLRMGQMSQNALTEILEIMYIDGTEDKLKGKIRNPLGLAAKSREKLLGGAFGNIKKIEAYKKIGNLMMMEDERRRGTGEGHYTFEDLFYEMQRAQNQPWGDLYQNGQENKDAIERYENPQMLIGDTFVNLGDVKEFFKDYSMARTNKVLSVGVWGKGANYTKDAENLMVSDKNFEVEIIDPQTNTVKPTDVPFSYIKQLWSTKDGQDLIFKAFEPLDSGHESLNGMYLKNKKTGKIYFLELSSKMYRQDLVSLKEVDQNDPFLMHYSRDAKLVIENKTTGYNLQIDPIKNLSPIELRRYFGHKSTYTITGADKKGAIKTATVTAREYYDTQYGCLYDDVIDELEKIRQGRELGYKFATKMHQISNYREHSKVHKEFYEGLVMVESTTRNLIFAATLLGILVPSLTFLANPYFFLGTIFSALTINPFLNRYAKGWAAREIASINSQTELNQMSGQFWKLANEAEPPSFGELDIARSTFESIKFKYRSVLKNFGEAQYNTNTWTDLFGQLWGKISEKPF